jgi:hypothetical protein
VTCAIRSAVNRSGRPERARSASPASPVSATRPHQGPHRVRADPTSTAIAGRPAARSGHGPCTDTKSPDPNHAASAPAGSPRSPSRACLNHGCRCRTHIMVNHEGGGDHASGPDVDHGHPTRVPVAQRLRAHAAAHCPQAGVLKFRCRGPFIYVEGITVAGLFGSRRPTLYSKLGSAPTEHGLRHVLDRQRRHAGSAVVDQAVLAQRRSARHYQPARHRRHHPPPAQESPDRDRLDQPRRPATAVHTPRLWNTC